MKKKERNIFILEGAIHRSGLSFTITLFLYEIHFNLGDSGKSSDQVIQEIKAIG